MVSNERNTDSEEGRRKPSRLALLGLVRFTAFLASLMLFLAVLILPRAASAAFDFSVSHPKGEFQLKPGEHATRALWVNNDSDETIRITAYLGDWIMDAKGNEDYLEPGTIERSLCSWVTVSPSVFSIAAHSSHQVFYEVSVPEDTALEGSYWGMIFIEKEPPPVARRDADEGRPSVAIRAIVRYGVRLLLTVPGTEIRQAGFISSAATPTEEGFTLTALLRNDGNIYLRPLVWLELRDVAGEVIHSENHRLLTVLPENEREYSFDLSGLQLSAGKYVAIVFADIGMPNLIGAQCDIEVDGE